MNLGRSPSRWSPWLRAAVVLGALGAISALHVLSPLPEAAHDMGLHGLHSALEGLYFVPLLLAGYWWGRSPALLCGIAASVAYGLHVETQLGGLLAPMNRGRLLALFIRGAVEVLAQSPGLAPRDHEFADLLFSEIGRLETLVTGFLAFARPVRPGADRADALSAARVTLALLRPQADRQQVELVLDAPAEVPPVRCPEESLRQVLLNLSLNALQAMDTSGGTLRIRIAPMDGHVVLAVEDTGPGIPLAERERVFHPFVTSKPEGTGLGLSVAARAVHGCSGTIDIEDAPGRGARILIHLPQAPACVDDPLPDIVG